MISISHSSLKLSVMLVHENWIRQLYFFDFVVTFQKLHLVHSLRKINLCEVCTVCWINATTLGFYCVIESRVGFFTISKISPKILPVLMKNLVNMQGENFRNISYISMLLTFKNTISTFIRYDYFHSVNDRQSVKNWKKQQINYLVLCTHWGLLPTWPMSEWQFLRAPSVSPPLMHSDVYPTRQSTFHCPVQLNSRFHWVQQLVWQHHVQQLHPVYFDIHE